MGLGKDATASGIPMLLGNPHFPWTGTERLYIAHATLPGKIDIMAARSTGVPAINIGFNEHFAWSHYRLHRVPLHALRTDAQSRGPDAISLQRRVRADEGHAGHHRRARRGWQDDRKQTRTLYSSQYGPMMVLTASGVPVLGWNNLKA